MPFVGTWDFITHVIVSLSVLSIQVYWLVSKKSKSKIIIYLWIPVTILVEFPLLGTQHLMTRFRGYIIFDDRIWDLVLHLVYIFNLPLQTGASAYLSESKVKLGKLLKNLLITFIVACAFYHLRSWSTA